jgi:hypothetical protein
MPRLKMAQLYAGMTIVISESFIHVDLFKIEPIALGT